MKYFQDIKDLADLKEQFKKLCKIHHPDLGGDAEAMKALNNEYTELLKTQNFDFEKANTSEEIEEAHRNIIEQTIIFEGLIVELCGRWIWFTGETRKYKEELKALGCFWANKKKAWYWRPEDEKKSNRKPVPLDKIRSKYGCKGFKSEEKAKIQA